MEKKSFVTFQIEPITETILTTYDTDSTQERTMIVRLDKWLWAARFFKTRALARTAIEQGKVMYDGQKVIPSKEIEVGANVLIMQGGTKKSITIQKLSTRRRSNEEALELFTEIETRKHIKFLRSGAIHRSARTPIDNPTN